MKNIHIQIFQYVKNIDRIFNENESEWNKTKAFIGKKKTFEGMLIQVENVIEEEKKETATVNIRQTERLFAVLSKLLCDIDILMKQHEKVFPVFYKKYMEARNIPGNKASKLDLRYYLANEAASNKQ